MQLPYSEHIHLTQDGRAVVILDQTQLPNRTVFLTLSEKEALFRAIQTLQVRGAPCIGIFAGYSLYVLAQQIETENPAEFSQILETLGTYLISARPTAVNLPWAVHRMQNAAKAGKTISEKLSILRETCFAIHREDIAMCRAIAQLGLSLLHDGDGILTHCNAGPLATSQYGTALGPILLGKEQGYRLRVFADETRPLLQGARLTTYELQKAGVDVTLICDNMASLVMQKGWVQACLVGCDRIARNGDTANKIGTSGVAILAKHYGIPFYVLGPTSTIDWNCPDGNAIPIEERSPEEIKALFYREPMALPEVACYNPAFDVTDHSLITAIITEKGICRPPFSESLWQIAHPKV